MSLKKILCSYFLSLALCLSLSLSCFASPSLDHMEDTPLFSDNIDASLSDDIIFTAGSSPFGSEPFLFDNLPSFYRTQMKYSKITFYATHPQMESSVKLGSVDSFSGTPVSISGTTSGVYNKGLNFQIDFPNPLNFALAQGYTFAIDLEIECSSSQEMSLDTAKYGYIDNNHSTRYDMLFDGNIWKEWVSGVEHTFLRGTYYVTMPEWGAFPFVIVYLNTNWFVNATLTIHDIYYVSSEGQQLGGWSDSGMSNSNNQLGGALGELDDMQQNADNDLHDAISDMTQPDLDEQSTGVSFISSSVSMLWGALGGFQAVILCALALVVFNYISRYRGG